MHIRSDIKEFVSKLEVFAKRKLFFNAEVCELIQIVVQTGRTDEFNELIFQAKFLVRTQEVMKRIGSGAEGYEKLSAELESGVQKAVNLLKMLVSKSPLEVSQNFTNTFLVMETDSYNRLTMLLSDLSWIKNWQLDTKQLPYEFEKHQQLKECDNIQVFSSEDSSKVDPEKSISRIKKNAIMCIILFALLFFIDTPVTTLGWILSFGIAGLLMYIVIQIYLFTRSSKL